MVFFPAGSISLWHVTKEVRKLAFCRHTVPRPVGFALRAWKKLIAILSGPSEDSDPLASAPDVGADPERVRAA